MFFVERAICRILLFLGKNCYFCEEARVSSFRRLAVEWRDLMLKATARVCIASNVQISANQVPQAEKCFIRSLERYLRSPLRLEPEPFCYIQAPPVTNSALVGTCYGSKK